MTHAGKNELLSRATYNAQHLRLTITDAAGQTTTNAYNARGQLLTTTNPKNETTTYTYDTNGYPIALDGSLPGTNDTLTATYDAFGRVRTKTDDSGYIVTFSYDALDRMTNIAYPDGTFDQITYAQLQPAMLRDRAGRQTVLEYDALGNLAKKTDALGRVTLFQWCRCGEIKSLIDPLGRMTEWQTDVQGRIAAKQYGDGSRISYAYDNLSGRLREITDEKLQVTQFIWNRDNSLQRIAFLNTAVPTPSVSYTYDLDYHRIVSVTDGTGTTTNYYVPITPFPTLGAGRLASIDGPLANDTITYEYDELGRPVAFAINGVGQRVSYDATGRIVTETNALGAFANTYAGTSDRLISQSFPNGMTMTRGYGDVQHDLRLERITHQSGATPISEFIYTRDVAADRIATLSQQFGAQTPLLHTFGYDAEDQLLSTTVTNAGLLAGRFAYTYDPAANRLTEETSTATNTATHNALNQLSTIAGAASAARTNKWDANDRLVVVNSGNQRTEFTYDGIGRLMILRQLTNGLEVSFRRFVWNGNENCEERDAAGAVTKRFFRQGMKIETGPSAGVYFYTRDHLGSVRELVDASGTVRARYDYDPFGRRTKLSGDLETDFAFAGMFWSSEARLSLTRFRAYDAELGRWLSRDPLRRAEVEQGPNLYAYVGNNPINRVDPLGLCCEELAAAGARFWEEKNAQCHQLVENAKEECRAESFLRFEGIGENPFGPGACAVAHETAGKFCNEAQAQIDAQVKAWKDCLKKPCQPKSCAGSASALPSFDSDLAGRPGGARTRTFY